MLEAGARPVWIPSIEITSVSDTDRVRQMEDILSRISTFDHLLFTSKNGIKAVLDVLNTMPSIQTSGKNAADVLNDCGAEVWALGADSQVLIDEGISKVRTPTQASTAGLVEELKSLDLLHGRQILCPVPFVIDPLQEPDVVPMFLKGLLDGGAGNVVRMDSYETKLGCESNECMPEKEMLEAGYISVIAFTSTAEADALVHLVGRTSIDKAIEKGTFLAAYGPQTASGASKILGLPVDCINKDFSSFAGFIKELESCF